MKGYTLAILASFCFAFIGIFTNFIGNSIPGTTLNFYRMLIGTIALAFFMFKLDPGFIKVDRKDLPKLVLIGFLMSISFTIYIITFSLMPVSNVVVINAIYPVFLIPFSLVLLKEKISKFELASILIAITALFIINPLAPEYLTGSLLAIASSVIFALIVTYMRYEDRNHSVGIVFWFFVFASLFSSPSILIQGFGDFIGNIHWIVLMGVFSTALAYLFFNYALENLKAETAAIIETSFSPLFAIVLGFFILNQTPTINILFGGALLVLASIITQFQNKKHRNIFHIGRRKK